MTEQLIPLMALTFFVAGALAGLGSLRSSSTSVLLGAGAFVTVTGLWFAYGYSVTGDYPSSASELVAHVVLYGLGLCMFGGLLTIAGVVVTGLCVHFVRAARKSRP